MGADTECDGKKKYKSPRDAERAAKYCRRLRDTRLRFYRCRKCKTWHLTSLIDGKDARMEKTRRHIRGEG